MHTLTSVYIQVHVYTCGVWLQVSRISYCSYRPHAYIHVNVHVHVHAYACMYTIVQHNGDYVYAYIFSEGDNAWVGFELNS